MNDAELAGLDALPSEMEARALTESIKSATARVFGALADVEVAITEAYRRRAWASLGYESWETYCAAEFSETRLWASVEERHQRTLKLREAGMSQRAIVAVARSRNSSGYFLGAAMTLILHGLKASTRPGAIQVTFSTPRR